MTDNKTKEIYKKYDDDVQKIVKEIIAKAMAEHHRGKKITKDEVISIVREIVL